ncbi:MAG: hypothetical protein KAH05_00850 [Clostridiales bacterium]|nr:hypothetical protein [Clostridiales bacterium]
MIDLVSYGGTIVKVYNLFERFFMPYSNKLTKMDLSITYNQGDSILTTAEIFISNKVANEYILYMNNVYWSTNSNIDDLLEFAQ